MKSVIKSVKCKSYLKPSPEKCSSLVLWWVHSKMYYLSEMWMNHMQCWHNNMPFNCFFFDLEQQKNILQVHVTVFPWFSPSCYPLLCVSCELVAPHTALILTLFLSLLLSQQNPKFSSFYIFLNNCLLLYFVFCNSLFGLKSVLSCLSSHDRSSLF